MHPRAHARAKVEKLRVWKEAKGCIWPTWPRGIRIWTLIDLKMRSRPWKFNFTLKSDVQVKGDRIYSACTICYIFSIHYSACTLYSACALYYMFSTHYILWPQHFRPCRRASLIGGSLRRWDDPTNVKGGSLHVNLGRDSLHLIGRRVYCQKHDWRMGRDVQQ